MNVAGLRWVFIDGAFTSVTSTHPLTSSDSSSLLKFKVEHVELKDQKDSLSLGSVFHVENCFPPAFVTRAMDTGIPTLPFMRDGMKPGKDRLSRISANVPGTPFRSRNANPFLMLPDTSRIFEGEMLQMGNYLNAYLHAHVKNLF